jgi:hypothetical protein
MPAHRLLRCWIAALLLGPVPWQVGGCAVTEVRPVEQTERAPANRTQAARPAEIPFDRSAVAAVVNSRVVLATRAIGTVPFDGQVLPLISPSGRYLATQTGEAPDWPSLLGARGQSVSMRTSVEAYDLASSPPRRISWTEDLPPGSLLGRSADEAGFLIERVLPDATRRIGKVSWASGGVTWLTAEGDLAAAGTLLPPGSAAAAVFTLRELGDDQRRLMIRGRGGVDIRAEPGVSYHMPTATSTSSIVLAMTQTTSGSDLIAIRVEGSDQTPPRSTVLARHPISSDNDPMIAYQAMSPLQSPPPLPADADGAQPPGLMFFHPSASRMAVFDYASGGVTLLAERSIAGAWHLRRTQSGEPVWSVFLTTPDGLKHQTVLRSGRALEASPAVDVSEEVWVPRATNDAVRPYILIGPSERDPRGLRLVEMRPVDPPR